MSALDPNDPRLTAYALGELDREEAAAIERQIAEDESLAAAVNEIRQTASLLSAEFAAEPALGLTDEQRRSLEQRPEPALNNPWIFRARTLWTGAGLAAAACLTIVLVLPMMFDRARSSTEIARSESQPIERGIAAEQHEFDRTADAKRDGSSTKLGVPLQEFGQTPTDSAIVGGALDGAMSAPPAENAAGQGAGGGLPPSSENPARDPFVGKLAAQPPAAAPSGGGLGGGAPIDQQARTRYQLESRSNDAPSPASAAPRPPGDRLTEELAKATVTRTGPARSHERYRRDLHFREDLDAERDKGELGVVKDNEFRQPLDEPLSTFSIDVDTASYSNVRQHLNSGQLPSPRIVRIEEMVNYFDYGYEAPSGEQPFSANVEVNAAPWNPEHRLVRIGLKGKEVKTDMRPATSLVFLLDVSGSMNQPNKLPLVKQSMKLLVDKLNADDRLAIVTYAGSAGLLQDSIYCNDENKQTIVQRIDGLQAGGSTNGAGGIQMAYEQASQHFIKGGVNRVILCTDGDFNVGISGDDELTRFIEDKRKTGVFLSVLGFGTGNFQEAKMEKLADHGNGMFAYIDQIEEGKKVLVDQMAGTLVTIAKDVKIQVEFNPAKVGAYRLIGYE
ncbi:MAG: von Willebrand factor type A domain-containing protein, partial [Phycisphaerales bacterium]|nr:von Willebrand factor type A domain-containing protein [Phycisphaerales bacterium]